MSNSSSKTSSFLRGTIDPIIAGLDRPVPAGVNAAQFGSDVVVDALRATGEPYIAINPGASYRGLHDSIVNYLGNEQPQMLLCLHEESAVAIAHGYAKVTGKAMAVAVHSNVGLMHATMAVFNAWCDRMPILMLGATGPVDATKRRPWIDWIHTAADQGALIRGYTKWDDQPASPVAAREAVLRANWIANTAPCGPVYVNLDAGMQEAKLDEPVPPIDAARFMPQSPSAAAPDRVAVAAELLRNAKRPLIMAGRGTRDIEAWNARIALAERLGARVVTDLKIAAGFPTDHPLLASAPGIIAPAPAMLDALRAADVILSLDWLDVAGTFKSADEVTAKVIQVTVDHHLHNGWSLDYQGLPPVDVMLACTPEVAVPAILRRARPRQGDSATGPTVLVYARRRQASPSTAWRTRYFAAVGDRTTTLTHVYAVHGTARAGRSATRLDYSRQRRRRRCRGRPRHFGGRGTGAERLGPAAGRGLRRRRFPYGRHRAVDCGALQDPAPDGDRQQPLLLQ